MTAPTTTVNAPAVAPRLRSRLRACIVVATLTAIGFAALAWAAFVSPLPRLTYNPSDSVAVGWYRIEPFDPRTASLPRPLPWRAATSNAISAVLLGIFLRMSVPDTGASDRCSLIFYH